MENKPLLSICIPTYNRANFLKECLDSIVTQYGFNEKEIEIIISDNASKDNTTSIVKSYQKKFKNIKYNRNKSNLGFDKNLDSTTKNALGNFCWLMGDDEILLKKSLNKIIKIIKNNPNIGYICVNADIEFNIYHTNMIYIKNGNEMLNKYGLMCGLISKNIINRLYLEKDTSKYYGSFWIHVGLILNIIKDNKILLITDLFISTQPNFNRKGKGINELIIFRQLKKIINSSLQIGYKKIYIKKYIYFLSKKIPISIIIAKTNGLNINIQNINIIIKEMYKFPFIMILSLIALFIPTFLTKYFIKKLKINICH